MRVWILLAALGLSVGLSFGDEACAVNVLTDQEKAEGWRLLWNGKTGAGWRSLKAPTFPAYGWEIRDGVLTVLAKKEGGGAGDIITEAVFTNFILKADFRLTAAANSGIKYFYRADLHKGTTLEYQLLDRAHPDAVKGLNGNRTIASLYDVIPAHGAEPKPVGEWNSAMLVCQGAHVEHWLNGKKVLAFERGSEAFRAAVAASKFKSLPNWGEQPDGHILLQDHQDRVSYRNIKIKVLGK